jgi:GntR family transcriptional regulator, arabinose operon transcriptional repressor
MSAKLSKKSNISKVEAVQRAILAHIHDGQLKAGDKILSEAEWIEKLKVSKNTVREAIGLMVHRGMLTRRQGSGTFITKESELETLRIGVVAMAGDSPFATNPYIAGIIAGIAERTARDAPFLESVLLSASRNPHGDDGLYFLDAVRTQRVDALVVTVTEPMSEEDLSLAEECGCPIIFLGLSRMETQRPWIKPDFFSGSYQASRHCIDRGRNRIGLLLSIEGSFGSIECQAGYCAAHIGAGRSIPPDLTAFTNGHEYSVPDVATPLLHRGADAILCYDDGAAARLIQLALWKGKKIPEDLAVIGANDSLGTVPGFPALTTLMFPTTAMGRMARNLVLREIEQRTTSDHAVVFQPTLIRRESA